MSSIFRVERAETTGSTPAHGLRHLAAAAAPPPSVASFVGTAAADRQSTHSVAPLPLESATFSSQVHSEHYCRRKVSNVETLRFHVAQCTRHCERNVTRRIIMCVTTNFSRACICFFGFFFYIQTCLYARRRSDWRTKSREIAKTVERFAPSRRRPI